MPRSIPRARALFGAFAGVLLVIQALQPFVNVGQAAAVGPAPSTTIVGTSKTPTVFGESVTFTATITSANPPAPTGTVAFTGPGATPISGCGAAPVTPVTGPTGTTSTATCTTSALPVGVDTVTASYSGDTVYATSQGAVDQTVNKAATSGAITSAPNPSLQNESVTITDTISVTAPGSGTPTGTVAFSTPAGPIAGCAAQTVTANKATCTTTFPTRGAITVTGVYSGDANFTGNTATGTQNVGQVPSSTALSSSANPSVFGQAVTFTAKVTSTHVGTPTGTVTFTDGTPTGTVIAGCGNVPLDATVSATCTPASLTVGTHPITAVYNGDANFASSTSPVVSQVVNRAATTTTASSSPNPSVFTQPVTLSALVAVTSPGGGSPTGNVTFKEGTTTLCTGAVSSGQASCNVSNLAVGAHPITAVYAGDTNFVTSTSTNADTQTVNKAATTTAVSSSKNPTVSGEGVTFTATVAAASPATGTPTGPTGSVAFKDGGTTFCTVTLVAGTASCGTATLTPGTHNITASYTGDANYTASDSTVAVLQQVNKASSGTVVTSSKNPAEIGDNVTYTATVSPVAPGTGVPSGTVTFAEGGNAIGGCGAVILTPGASNATATCTVSNPPLGTHAITATYSGDGNFNTSTSPVLNQVVNKHGTATGLTAAPTSPSTFGTPVQFTASVSATTASVPAPPDGTVTFTDSVTASAICPPVTLVSGSASCTTTTPLAVGAHTITAAYSGNADYGTSTTNIPYTVTKAATTTDVTSSKANPVKGEAIDLTATITTTAPGTPTGTVSFTSNGTAIAGCSNLTLSASPPLKAVCTTSALPVGNSNSIVATYSGDGTYATSSGLLTQAVGKADTTATVSSSLNPSVKGQSLTFTANVTVNSPGSGTPTGTIVFKDGASTLCTVATTAPTCTVPNMAVGTHAITATYNGDSSFNASPQSSAVSQVVNKADTTTAVSSSAPGGVLLGQPVTFTATVAVTSPGSGTPTGTVDFKSDGVAIPSCTGKALAANGTATCNTTANALGNGDHLITAVYSGDAGYNTSTSPAITQPVGHVASTTVLTSSPNPSVSGQAFTLTASVSSTAPGTPTGTVNFQDNGTTLPGCGAVPIDLNGEAQCTSTAALAAGDHAMTAIYSGDANFNTSTGSLTQTISSADTTTALQSGTNPSVATQPVTFTATVTVASPGAGTPTGTADFKNGTAAIAGCTGQPVAVDGTATCTTSALPVGTDSVTAVYNGDGTFNSSTSSAVSQVVNQASSTTAVVSDIDPSVSGQGVTYTATVSPTSPATGTPTGTVTFKDGTTTVCPTATVTAGQATCGATPAAGTRSITAVYNGDDNFATSTSPALTQTVNPAGTTTGLVSDVNPSLATEPVTFTATITVTAPGSGTPTGTVTFKDGATAITGCTASPVAPGGTATCTTGALPVGTDSVTAVYNGDANFTTSTSTAVSQVVNQATSTTGLTSSANPSVSGQPVTFTATVTPTAPAAGTPTGTVDFSDGATPITGCTGRTVGADGTATCPISSLSLGTHQVTAAYNGDANFGTSASSAVNQVVNQAASGTALTSTANPSTLGQSVTFTATVTPTSPATGTPTGTVAFKDGATTICPSVTLVSGQASCTTPFSTTGTHPITGVYSGDTDFATSTSPALNQVVNKVGTATGVTSSANPSGPGQSVTFTATVTTGSGTPTGTVTFKDGSATLCSAVALAAGQASCAAPSLGAGNHSITAVYSGDATFATSTSSVLTQTVNSPPPPVVHHSGYWMLTRAGQVFAFGDAQTHGNAPTGTAVHIEPTPAGDGYWVVDEAGHVFGLNAGYFGGATDRLLAGESVTSLSATPDGKGYWIFTNKGRVITFGNAPFKGDMSGTVLNGPVLGSVSTPTGQGYYMVASDGGVFAFGDAKFRGSMGGQFLNAPVQSLVPTRSNAGYWLVASDGGIFSFGDAQFKGSMGGKRLNAPISGVVRFGDAYLMVARDGGVFNFSNKPFAGSLGNNPPASPVIGVGTLDD
jgi:hypothetical protein